VAQLDPAERLVLGKLVAVGYFNGLGTVVFPLRLYEIIDRTH
jgi:hypothetical protein